MKSSNAGEIIFSSACAEVGETTIPTASAPVKIFATNFFNWLFWLYTRKIGCYILWEQNKERYRQDGTSWDCICDMQKDAWSKFSLDSLVTNRDKKFCDADTLTEEMKELLIEKILVYSNNVLEIYWKADFIKYFSDTSRIIGKETGKNE